MINRVPLTIWGTLYLIAILSMTAMGYHSRLTGKRSPVSTIILVFTFAAVMTLIIDLDRPMITLFNVDQQVLVNVLKQMNPPDS